MTVCTAIIVLVALAVYVQATETSSNSITSPELTAGRLKKHTPSLVISPATVLYKLKQKQNIVLADVRNSAEFKQASIPGAINVPLHSVKTKAFLKTKPVVLVNGGYPDGQMEAECKKLQNKGFNVSILSGGLLSWYRQGGPIQGDLLFLNPYKTISPLTFYQGKDRHNQIIIDVSNVQSAQSKQLLPDAIHISLPHNPKDLDLLLSGSSAQLRAGPVESNNFFKLRKLRASAVNKNNFRPVLVFNQNGDKYEQIEKIMKTAGLENVFFLTGGLKEYQRFLRHLTLSRQSKDSRIKTTSQCPSCGTQKEKE